jgi:very-short-patch-repair endonuclease
MGAHSRLDLPELAFARRQRGLVTHAQLTAAGLSAKAIRHRVRTGRLHVIHPGVYAVGRPDLSREGRWLAAVLACGDDAALSHLPAALLWGIAERGDERPHVTVPTQAGRKAPAGVTLHRSPTLTAADVVDRYGIPVTSLIRTLIDRAGTVEPQALRAEVRRAVVVHRLDLRALRAAVAQPLSAPGKARLRAVVADYAPVDLPRSELEERFFELCRRHRLPLPSEQQRHDRYRLDFVWADVRLIVETDGRDTHDNAVAFHDDRVRDRRLKAAGYEVLRFTWAEIVHHPGDVAREIRAAIRRRRRELGGAVAKRPL